MPAYALAHLRTPQINDEVLEYIERIQATLDPYRGRFLVHGAEVDVKEGPWPGTVVIIEFPDDGAAQDWYVSPAYQEILPLRTRNIDGSTLIVEGVAPDYDPARTAAALRKAGELTTAPRRASGTWFSTRLEARPALPSARVTATP